MFRYAKAGAISVLVGFLLPVVVDGGGFLGGTRTFWFWDLFGKAPAGMVLLNLLPLFLGIASLVVLANMQGRARAITLFSMAGGTCVILLAVTSDGLGVRQFGFGRRMSMNSGVAAFFLLTFASTALAAANHVRKFHLRHAGPRLLAGFAGCGILLSYVIPIANDVALISAFGEAGAWEHAWSVLLVLAAGLTYGILGTCHFARGRTREGLCATTTAFGRALIIGTPLAILIVLGTVSKGQAMGTMLMLLLKGFLMIYGVLALLGVGIAGWMASSISGSDGLSADIRRAFDEPPPNVDLKARLARLKQAHDEGLLTEAEYELKRTKIIDGIDF